MTSTNIFQGMESGNKTSSRVLAPPGGGSSNIFGGEPAPTRQPPKPQPAAEKQQNVPVSQPAQQGRNIRAAPKQAFNPITGEPYGAPAAQETPEEEKKDSENPEGESPAKDTSQPSQPAPAVEPREHTSTRVLNPPGGKTTQLW